MAFKLKTSKKTAEIFDRIEGSECLPCYTLVKLAIALSLRSKEHLKESDFHTNTLGRELNRQTMENDMTVYIVIFDRAAYQISGKLFADIAEYIDDHYVDEHTDSRRERLCRLNRLESKASRVCEDATQDFMAAPCAPMSMSIVGGSLDDMLDELDAGFSETLLKLIDRTGKKDSEIYKKANVDRKLFSKIRNNPDCKPSKTTAIAFAIALELDLEETKDFIARAGFALSRSSKFDVIIEYFIKQKNYDVFAINEVLFAFDQSLLGA